jgi:Ca2+-binding RTX toxin-like protein
MANVTSTALGQALTADTSGTSQVLAAGSPTWVANLTPMNNSGVSGTATMSLSGGQLTVNLDLTGLTANQPHQAHIHGSSAGGQAVQSIVAPPTTADANNDGTVSQAEAQATAGPPILDLTGATGDQGTTSNGHLQLTQSFDLNGATSPTAAGTTPTDLFPLAMRSIEVHGGNTPGTTTFDATLPVAAAQIEPGPNTLLAAQTQQAPTVLVAGTGNDVLLGGQFNDVLQGGSGNNTLAGNAGNNVLTGGTGTDHFLVGPGQDVITDFKPSEGDRLALHVGDNPQTFLNSAQDSSQGLTLATAEGGHVTLAGIHQVGTAADWIA